uniref:Uncharacterized protein n=1 Tax=Globodera rostochiensis TaxID=31243 RepID=A0A914HN28_GLORO
MISRLSSRLRTFSVLPRRFGPVANALSPSSTIAADSEVKKYDNEHKELRLKQIERAFDQAVPKLLHGSFNNLVMFHSQDSFRFEDKVWGYETDSLIWLILRLMKIRFYLAVKSPHNRFETVGTYIFLEGNLVTLIWRLSQTKNIRSAYGITPKMLLANFSKLRGVHRDRSQIGRIETGLTEKEPSTSSADAAPLGQQNDQKTAPLSAVPENLSARNLVQIEHCLDIYVSDLGLVKRLVVRHATSHDYEMAKMRKMELENEIDDRWRRATREQKQNN